jgi:hypothetical protein
MRRPSSARSLHQSFVKALNRHPATGSHFETNLPPSPVPRKPEPTVVNPRSDRSLVLRRVPRPLEETHFSWHMTHVGVCQRCHMLHDRRHHLAQHWVTYRRRSAVGDLFLGPYPAMIAALTSKRTSQGMRSVETAQPTARRPVES